MSSSDGGGEDRAPATRTGPKATYPVERSAPNRRRWFYGLSVLVVLMGLGLAYVGFQQFGDPEVSGEATSFEVTSSGSVFIQYTVNRADPGQAVACVVRAREYEGAEVGRREVLIPPGDQRQVAARTEVLTSEEPVVGEVFGCTTNVPPYLKPIS